ncbi:unnamed protein product [Linum trigynum]|uniref:Endonuclease/exonuclease/phosphatase domain-containing protein n=1 Tax=Linum trigynum TaxID=586398 RepID=A0AAV2GPD7_9ROSI
MSDHGKRWPTNTTGGGRAGGLSIWWTSEVSLTCMDTEAHFLDMQVNDRHKGPWRFTGVYGRPGSKDKDKTNSLLKDLSKRWGGPWLVGGDLNQIEGLEEKTGGRRADDVEMSRFTCCFTEAGLNDLSLRGYEFTWENRRGHEGYIEERLDRFLGNDLWILKFPEGRVQHLDQNRSDHRPIACRTEGDEDEKPRWGWSFRFDPFWAKHEECAAIVEDTWKGNLLTDTFGKLSFCQQKREDWSRERFPNFNKQRLKILRAMRSLERLQKTELVLQQLKQLQTKLNDLEDNEEQYWKQQSRAD